MLQSKLVLDLITFPNLANFLGCRQKVLKIRRIFSNAPSKYASKFELRHNTFELGLDAPRRVKRPPSKLLLVPIIVASIDIVLAIISRSTKRLGYILRNLVVPAEATSFAQISPGLRILEDGCTATDRLRWIALLGHEPFDIISEA
ncbi:hypothetical protein HG531_004457 [Fusarium graminearum]|nr:hypothetical protein HG531_004457 [Fusarium graminearum]